MSIQLSETARNDIDNAYGNNVSNVDNSSDNTKYSVKMPWLCMLCKMCDVRVCISTFSEKGDQLQKCDIIFFFDICCCIFFFDL